MYFKEIHENWIELVAALKLLLKLSLFLAFASSGFVFLHVQPEQCLYSEEELVQDQA